MCVLGVEFFFGVVVVVRYGVVVYDVVDFDV